MEIPRFHPDTIEEVKQRVDIVDVISEYVVLRKRGKDYLGLCPFHEEKTPSFSVNPSKQLYHCFGCRAAGNTFNFLMELGKRSFSDVVLDLAQRYQVPIKTLEPQQRQELQRQVTLREQLYEILALTASFYQHALRQPQGELALKYIKAERKLSEETIQQFQLGYAPAGWETLYRYLVEQKRYSVGLVEQAGLIKKRKSGDGYYDQFRDRLMIPIHDSQGRIIAFGSRTLASEEPKYLNSPETTLFNKSKTLFALDKARNSISKQDRAVVVEGYFDAIALHACGISNVVASLGTALSKDQLRQLLRYTFSKQVVLNFDADSAGTTATQRAIKEIETLVYSGQVQLRVLNLPDGKDADEFLKSAPDAAETYRTSLQAAPLWLDWQISQLLVTSNLKQADQFEQVAQKMVKLLNQLEDANKRTHYIRYCAELLSQGNSRLIPLYTNNLLAQLKKPQLRSAVQKNNSSPLNLSVSSESSLLEEAEALLLLIYLHCPEHRQEIIDALEEKDLLFSFSHHRFLWQQITQLQDAAIQQPGDTSNRLLSLLQDRSIYFPEQIAQVAHLLHPNEKTIKDIFRAPSCICSAIASLERVARQRYLNYCLQQWQNLNPATESERMQYYYQELQNAEWQIRELEEQRLARAKSSS
ncbi:MAG: DNA primase [Xenococcaceae cyanobacterium]